MENPTIYDSSKGIKNFALHHSTKNPQGTVQQNIPYLARPLTIGINLDPVTSFQM